MNPFPQLRVFGLNGTAKFAKAVAESLGVGLTTHHEKNFADNEVYLKSDANVRGCDVFIIQSLHTCQRETVNDRLMKLFVLVGALRDASAERITVVSPYLCYQRQDRKVESREPITTKYLAMMLEQVGVDRVLTMDVHNRASFWGCFRIPVDHLEAKKLLAGALYERLDSSIDTYGLSVVTDIGGTERGEEFCDYLSHITKRNVELATAKKRHKGDKISVSKIIGDVEGRVVVVYDDMISSGKTVAETVAAAKKAGGKVWGLVATHPLFVGGQVSDNLSCVPKMLVTDTIDRHYALSTEIRDRVETISTAKLFADAIRRIHEGTGSISDLLKT